MGNFLGFCILMIASMFAGVNMSFVNITEKSLEEPLKLCSANEGIKRVVLKVFDEPNVYCNNGAKFTSKKTKK